jgi:hypothetical protein
MATVTATLLNGAITKNDTSVRLDAVTGFSKGRYFRIDNEWLICTSDADATALTVPCKRGELGTAAVAHVDNSPVVVTDDPNDSTAPQTVDQLAEPIPTSNQLSYPRYSYAASGALTPTRGIHMLIGTGALAMTLAVPSKLRDTDEMVIIGNGKAAHTVTLATAVGDAGAGYTVLTFPAGGQVGFRVMAMNGIWVLLSPPISGTATNITVAIA